MSATETAPEVLSPGTTASSTTRTCATPILQRNGQNNALGKLVTTGNVADNWIVWKQMWSNYMVIAQLEMQLPAYKVALFLHCIGANVLKIFNGFQFDSPHDRNDLAKIIQKFNEFTIGELNETFERHTFNTRHHTAMMTSTRKAAQGNRRHVNSVAILSRVGSEMYKVQWQKSFRSNLHNSD